MIGVVVTVVVMVVVFQSMADVLLTSPIPFFLSVQPAQPLLAAPTARNATSAFHSSSADITAERKTGSAL